MFYDFTIRKSSSVYENMRNPRFLKRYYRFKTIDLIKTNEIYGSSPPDIFVGRIEYPDVYIGPLVPPIRGDTSIMGEPESWVDKSIPEIVEFRSLLVRGMQRTRVTNADNGKTEEMLKEIAIADSYTDVSMKLSHIPSLNMSFNENSQPFGPSARLTRVELGTMKANRNIENAYLDTDMTATNAIVELYGKGILVSKIQKALSAGILGRKNSRRFVPTRWGITATDDTLSKYKLKVVKEYEPIDGIRIYENLALDNRWVILMVPGSWEYESMEAWYPNTTWNMNSNEIDIGSSYESYNGRKTYAEIGGCYYAARLAVSEFLDKLKRQAKVVILREVHSGYIMPVGVWNVREHVREAFRKEPKLLADVDDAFAYIAKKLEIPITTWIKSGILLKSILRQRTITRFL